MRRTMIPLFSKNETLNFVTQIMGENITKEWDADLYGDELWDALQLLRTDGSRGIIALSHVAEKGSSLAMTYLGNHFLNSGSGSKSNKTLGEQWLARAADKGSIEGMFMLARHLVNEQRFSESKLLYEKMAALNYSPAQFCLGYFYLKGKYGAVDIEKSVYWFGISTKNGHFHSRKWLSIINMKYRGGILNCSIWILYRILFVFPYVLKIYNYPNSDQLRI